jgi:hypothetical protein
MGIAELICRPMLDLALLSKEGMFARYEPENKKQRRFLFQALRAKGVAAADAMTRNAGAV